MDFHWYFIDIKFSAFEIVSFSKFTLLIFKEHISRTCIKALIPVVMDWILSHQNEYVQALTLSVTVLGQRAFKK